MKGAAIKRLRVAAVMLLVVPALVVPDATGASASTNTPSQRIERAVQYAESQVGSRYSWGGTGPSAYDCSGLIYRAYRQAEGFDLPRTSHAMSRSFDLTFRVGPGSRWSLRRGDLLFFSWSRDGRVTHAGIYLGNGQMVDASGSQQRVVKRQVFWDALVQARRIRIAHRY